MRSSSSKHWRSGEIGVDPNPATAGAVVSVSYTGTAGAVYWKASGGSGGEWQVLKFGKETGTVFLQIPEDAKFIDFNDRDYPTPSTLTVRVVPDPSPVEPD